MEVGDGVGQRHRDLVQQTRADLVEAAVAFLGRQIHDPQDRPVLVPELEEAVTQLCRGGDACLALPRPLADQRGQAMPVERHLLGQHQDGRFDVGEVLIEGRRRRARLASDVDDLQIAIAGRAQHLRGELEQSLSRRKASSSRNSTVGRARIGVGRRTNGRKSSGSDDASAYETPAGPPSCCIMPSMSSIPVWR